MHHFNCFRDYLHVMTFGEAVHTVALDIWATSRGHVHPGYLNGLAIYLAECWVNKKPHNVDSVITQADKEHWLSCQKCQSFVDKQVEFNVQWEKGIGQELRDYFDSQRSRWDNVEQS